MNTKICTLCNTEKKFPDEFWRPTRSSWCKTCSTERNRKIIIANKIKAIEYKGSTCEDCGAKYPDLPYAAWDFHHINPYEKEFSWTQMRKRKWETVIKELDKCMLLCANCHRIRHCTDCDK